MRRRRDHRGVWRRSSIRFLRLALLAGCGDCDLRGQEQMTMFVWTARSGWQWRLLGAALVLAVLLGAGFMRRH